MPFGFRVVKRLVHTVECCSLSKCVYVRGTGPPGLTKAVE